jgi:hypothetical protein
VFGSGGLILSAGSVFACAETRFFLFLPRLGSIGLAFLLAASRFARLR